MSLHFDALCCAFHQVIPLEDIKAGAEAAGDVLVIGNVEDASLCAALQHHKPASLSLRFFQEEFILSGILQQELDFSR